VSLPIAVAGLGLSGLLVDWRRMGGLASLVLITLSLVALPLVFARRLTSSPIDYPQALSVVTLLVSMVVLFGAWPRNGRFEPDRSAVVDSSSFALRAQAWLLARSLPLGVALAAGVLAPLVAFHSSLVAAQLLATLAVAPLAAVATERGRMATGEAGTRRAATLIWALLALMVAIDSPLAWVVAGLAFIPSGLAVIEKWAAPLDDAVSSRVFWASVAVCVVGLALTGLALEMLPSESGSAYYN
jgi:hypothetical protein